MLLQPLSTCATNLILQLLNLVDDSKWSTPVLPNHSDMLPKLERSVEILMNHLAKGHNIYGAKGFLLREVNAYKFIGVNTGFGGSADSRTKEVVALQEALMQLTQAGILNFTPTGKP